MKIAQSFLITYLKPVVTWTVANRGQIKNMAGVAALFGGLVALGDIDRDRFVRKTARFSLTLADPFFIGEAKLLDGSLSREGSCSAT